MEITVSVILRFIAYGILVFYIGCLLMIFFYSLTQLNMLRYFLKYIKQKKDEPSIPRRLPKVTIQLPIYNEVHVIKRLLKCITAMEYPKDLLQIQVLEDSTDECLEISKALVLKYKKQGIPIEIITRKNREGFKAGALKNGLTTANGEYIAIFDSDFLPKANWILKAIPHFNDPKVGVVQTRWGHLNRNYSILTKVQSFALDAHFILEQVGRNQQQHFINFNGTAGIWRKSCIIDAGNWEGDTLAEDLDLSYRAQFKNWKFKYLLDVVTPAELPITINAIRSQQFRWNKGGAENFRKHIGRIMTSKDHSVWIKINSFFHLINSSMFLNIIMISFLSVPLLFIKKNYPELSLAYNISTLFIVSTIIFFICYWFVYKYVFGGGISSFYKYIRRFVSFYTLAMGFSIHNSIAVLEGYIGKKSPFVRTPKFDQSDLKNNQYNIKKISVFSFFEIAMSIYFLFGMYVSIIIIPELDIGLFLFHLFLFLGFSGVSYHSLKQSI